MRFLSLFSGIEAASVAWKPLGWECVGVAEIEPFPCRLLKHHYPEVPNIGSVSDVTEDQIKQLGHIDLVVGGFPCQDLSVAGKRKGLKNTDGSLTRSGLFYDAMRIVRWSGARWLLLENVPGMFSSNNGKDFAALVGELLGCEFGVPRDGWQNTGVAASEIGLVEWSTLDAQFFGVAQRRRRVFIVRDSGNWASREPLFLVPKGLSGHPAPSRQAGKGSPRTPEGCTPVGSLCARTGRSMSVQDADQGHLIGWPASVAPTLDSHYGEKMGLENQHINGGGCLSLAKCLITKTRLDAETETLIPTTGGHFSQAIALAENTIGRQPENGGNGDGFTVGGPMYTRSATGVHGVAQPTVIHGTQDPCVSDIAFAQGRNNGGENVMVHAMVVRRLTPKECERLQGFPDGWTDIQPNGKPTPDGPRYKALGNSMAVPVMRWIGERMNQVEQNGEAVDILQREILK